MRRLALDQADRDTLALAFIPWICGLALIVLLAVPILGWTKAGAVALVWLAALFVAACFVLCARRLARTAQPARRRRGASFPTSPTRSSFYEGRSAVSPIEPVVRT